MSVAPIWYPWLVCVEHGQCVSVLVVYIQSLLTASSPWLRPEGHGVSEFPPSFIGFSIARPHSGVHAVERSRWSGVDGVEPSGLLV